MCFDYGKLMVRVMMRYYRGGGKTQGTTTKCEEVDEARRPKDGIGHGNFSQ